MLGGLFGGLVGSGGVSVVTLCEENLGSLEVLYWWSSVLPQGFCLGYRIVASTDTCYYSENQIFYSLE